MIEQPDRHIPAFAEAGADIITVHVETCPHLHRTLQQLKELGVMAGVTLNPATPLVTLEEILSEVDLVLIMSVNPGFRRPVLHRGQHAEDRPPAPHVERAWLGARGSRG